MHAMEAYRCGVGPNVRHTGALRCGTEADGRTAGGDG